MPISFHPNADFAGEIVIACDGSHELPEQGKAAGAGLAVRKSPREFTFFGCKLPENIGSARAEAFALLVAFLLAQQLKLKCYILTDSQSNRDRLENLFRGKGGKPGPNDDLLRRIINIKKDVYVELHWVEASSSMEMKAADRAAEKGRILDGVLYETAAFDSLEKFHSEGFSNVDYHSPSDPSTFEDLFLFADFAAHRLLDADAV